jgi:hypothetical protein
LEIIMDKILFTIALGIRKIHYVNTNQKRLKMTNWTTNFHTHVRLPK